MEDKIPKIIKKEFNASVTGIRRITEGYSHFMYEVKINKKPHIAILRFANNVAEDVNLSKEKYVIETLAKNSIPVPKIYAFHYPKNREEGYIIMEKLQGIRLDTIWESLPREDKLKITKKIGMLMARIHSISFNIFGDITEGGKIKEDSNFKFRSVGKEIEYNPFLQQNMIDIFKDLGRLVSYGKISEEFILQIIRLLYSKKDTLVYNGEPVLIHGDIFPGHIFVKKEANDYNIVGIIDFEFAKAYAPEYDFIKLHRAGFFSDPELKSALIKGYRNPINEEAISIHRLMRDIAFAQVLFVVGNTELAEKTLASVKEKIDKIIL